MATLDFKITDWLTQDELETIEPGTIFEFTINMKDELKAVVQKVTNHLEIYHIYAIITDGKFKGKNFHVQYDFRHGTGHIWIS